MGEGISKSVLSEWGWQELLWGELPPHKHTLFPKLGLCELTLLQQQSAGCAVALTTLRLARLFNHLLCVNSTSSWALYVWFFVCVPDCMCIDLCLCVCPCQTEVSVNRYVSACACACMCMHVNAHMLPESWREVVGPN